MTVVVAVGYWGAVRSPDDGLEALDLLPHGVNTVIMLLDIGLSRAVSRHVHLYIPVLYSLIYQFWAIAHHFAGVDNGSVDGTSIYGRVTRYSSGLAWTTFAGVFIFVPIIHMCVVKYSQITTSCCSPRR